MALTFDGLAEVSLARDLLRRWWGLDLGLSEADGKGYVRASHATCESVRGVVAASCAAALEELAGELAKSKDRSALIRRCHAGMVLVVAPVFGSKGLAGVVYATGACTDRNAVEQKLVATIGCGPDEARALSEAVPQLSDGDLERVRDLVGAAAATVERAQPAEIPPTTHAHPFTEMVGDSPAVRDVVKLLTKVVRSEATVLIQGESGTGKELIARAIHYHGPRVKKPFVVQNCSAFNDNLLESALFGHVRGAFTGAVKDQPGLFQVADGGTFFLDEIGDMSAALQVKLLRVLQEGTFTPVGGTKPVKVDVRIIAASHKDLAAMVAHKQFREDLFYRVNVLKITVPPLRERVSDIPRLAQHFVNKHWRSPNPAPRLSQGALSRLVAYPWPGNIRELENEMERMLVLAGDATELTASMVSGRVSGIVNAAQSAPRPLRDVVANAEADAIVASLGRHTGDRELAAADLGVSEPLLAARMAALGIGGTGA
ncbi:MAG: sigma 54-interacting transcriptional regulator [Deltaproteobacteria bacterium]|nr:sigma 54-interacting transcriptional regulator [Deltaproteobacteria bacterium]MDQ3296032.1 sigma 54-interacting transcriptional regulator [Myxococcota bacterium]